MAAPPTDALTPPPSRPEPTRPLEPPTLAKPPPLPKPHDAAAEEASLPEPPPPEPLLTEPLLTEPLLTEPPLPEPPLPSEFVTEDLPSDFWDGEPSARPEPKARAPAAASPLFEELQSLFPGRVLRVEPLAKAQPDSAETIPNEVDEAVQNPLFTDALEDAQDDSD